MPIAARAFPEQGQQQKHEWGGSDRWMVQAQKQYPDYTAEALAESGTPRCNNAWPGNLLPPPSPASAASGSSQALGS